MKKLLANSWPTLASVALLAFAFPPLNFNLLVFVALVPWLAHLRRIEPVSAVRSGYLFGALYFWFQMFWIVPFVHRWTGSLFLAVLPWVVCGIIAGLFFALAAWLIKACFIRGWTLVIPFIWAGIEGFRAYIPGLAFPWGNMALPLWNYPWMVQHAAWGTMFLVSAWVMLANILLLDAFFPLVEKPHPRKILWAFVAFVGLAGISIGRYIAPVELTNKTIALGQVGVDMAFTPPEEELGLLQAATKEIKRKAAKPDLLVLPEGYAGRNQNDPVFTPFGPAPNYPLIMGGNRIEGERTYQTAFAWDGEHWIHADKTRLVVFGEYVPFRDQLPFLASFDLPAGDLQAGANLQTMNVAGLEIGPLICFEGVFPDLAESHSRQGAQILVQMSIDDWYKGTPAHDQLWMSSVWRSIESGLPLVRVGSRGRTLATDHRGNLIGFYPLGVVGGWPMTIGVPARSDAFDYRMGFVYLCWLVCAGIGGVAIGDALRGRRNRQAMFASQQTRAK